MQRYYDRNIEILKQSMKHGPSRSAAENSVHNAFLAKELASRLCLKHKYTSEQKEKLIQKAEEVILLANMILKV
jgi:hypothetical protein